MSNDRTDNKEPTEDEFERFVGELLKVDPKGLSGKHHADKESKQSREGSDHPK